MGFYSILQSGNLEILISIRPVWRRAYQNAHSKGKRQFIDTWVGFAGEFQVYELVPDLQSLPTLRPQAGFSDVTQTGLVGGQGWAEKIYKWRLVKYWVNVSSIGK